MAAVTARKRIIGWMMFDWATQPFYTLLLTFVFGPYFAEIATNYYLGTGLPEESAEASAQTFWSVGQVYIGFFIAFSAPVLGAIADTSGRRKPWMILFSVTYVIGCWSLWWMVPDGSMMVFAMLAFGVAMISAEYMLVFINAMLPSLGNREEIGQISGSGFALGYVGGVLSLFVTLLFIAENSSGVTFAGFSPPFGLDASEREGTRAVGPFAAVWFLVFMIPFFMWVRDTNTTKAGGHVGTALKSLVTLIKTLPRKPSMFSYLGSSMFYRDGLNAIYVFGGIYAYLILSWDIETRGKFGIVAAISAAVFSYLGGRADKRFGPKPVIVTNVWILIVVVTVIVSMSRESLFGFALPEGSSLPDVLMFVLGAVIGGAGGALQGASRTMMVRHTTLERPTEAFGLYAFSGKATAFVAPALIGLVTYMTDSARYGLSPIILLFIVALILLRWVNPDGNRESA